MFLANSRSLCVSDLNNKSGSSSYRMGNLFVSMKYWSVFYHTSSSVVHFLAIAHSTSQEALTLTVPDTITEWVGNGFCISETDGIGISSTSNLQAFQPFFVSYTLPYSVIRGETLPVKVTVFNYMTDCLMVSTTKHQCSSYSKAKNSTVSPVLPKKKKKNQRCPTLLVRKSFSCSLFF